MEKKFHQKTIEECFSKEKPPPESIQKELEKQLKMRNNWLMNKNKKQWMNEKIENMNEGEKL